MWRKHGDICLVISTKQKQARSIDNLNLNLIMNNSKLEIVTEQKHLGILVTNTLNWNKHVDHVCKKISKGIFALKKLKLYMDFKTRNLFLMLTYFLTLITAILYGAIKVLKSRQKCSSSRRNLQDISQWAH